ncbi:MAG: hypothetical protein BWY63_03876 [Chloroflexi bacterium ADurb.Bin360]|nr:MAG: hypothetical protein BWY63_03876 [Chloroflexi bacterium ADurb.Bin360]
MGATFGNLGVHTIYGFDTQQAAVFFSVLGRSHLPRDHVARAQSKTTDLALRDIGVIGTGKIARRTQETNAFTGDLQDPTTESKTLALRLDLQQEQDQVVFLQTAVARDVVITRQIAQFRQAHVIERAHVQTAQHIRDHLLLGGNPVRDRNNETFFTPLHRFLFTLKR